MLFLYAGLVMAMLLPIMAGLQIALSLTELEAGNDQVLIDRQASRQILLAEESSFMRQAIVFFSQQIDLATVSGPVCPALSGGLEKVGSATNCPYWLKPDPLVYPQLSRKGRGRFFVKITDNGAVSIRDYCFIDDGAPRQACSKEGAAA